MLRLPPFDKIGTTPAPDFVNADPTNSVPGSIVNGQVFNQLQHEGENLELLAGLTPSGTDLAQWAQAVSRGGIWCGQLTGTGDLAVATLGAVIPALLLGMRIGAVAAASNTVTNPKLRVVNIGSANLSQDFPILKEDGSLLAVGEIKAGRRYRYEPDGAGNVIITGGGISTAVSQAALGAAKVPFNEVIIPITQRVSMSLPANSAGQFVTALSGIAYAKQSASSRLVVQGAFTCFSPIIVGQGAAAVTHRLRATIGGTVLYDETTVTTGYYISNTNSPCHFGGSPLFVIDGLPAGNLTFDLLFKRDDNLAWSTILNPNTSDVPGYPTPNNGKLLCKEEFV